MKESTENENGRTPKKTYEMHCPKHRGMMTVHENGSVVITYAAADKPVPNRTVVLPPHKVFSNEEEARAWAEQELGAEFTDSEFGGLLDDMLS